MRVLTVVGARPEFIKSLALSRALRARGIDELVVHTGQHYDEDMSDVFFEELGLANPWRRLDISGGTHGAQTASMLVGLEQAILDAEPDWVVVYGDTNTTLAGALAAVKVHRPVAHVEAGLRSFNRAMPEEINRVVVDHISSMLLAPTRTATEHLRREGVADGQVHLVGDVNYDVTLAVATHDRVPTSAGLANIIGAPYVVATVHRAETTDDPQRLRAVLGGLEQVASQLPVVLPIHPRTRRAAAEQGIDLARSAMHVIDPVGFIEMIALMRHAAVIATDSGGVQKEALFLEVPCATLRTETEWVETVELGWNRLVDVVTPATVVAGVLGALGTTGRSEHPYGDGHAGDAIADLLRSS